MKIIIIGSIIVLMLILLYINIPNKKSTNYMDNLPFINKNELIFKETNIPLNLYQTWSTLNLPPKMKENVEQLKMDNPEFTHYLYDDAMCRDFIKTHFNKDVLYTFDKLQPGAYKADLFRYCILYINGGIYLDIKYKCINKFKLMYLTNNEYYVRDRLRNENYGIYQALLVCYPYNTILLKCIHDIINNVKNNFYISDSSGDLMVTGPFLMNKYFTKDEINNFKLNIAFKDNNINYNSISILESYKEYRTEQKNSTSKHYSKLYNEISIYNYYNLNNYNIKTSKYDIISKLCNIIINPSKENSYIVNIEGNNIIYQYEIDKDLNKNKNEIIKNNNIYNIKLFNYNNEIYYIGFIDNKDNTVNISFNKYNINIKEFIPNIIFSNVDKEIYKLNMINYKNELVIIKNWFPINIYKINDNKLQIIKNIYNLPDIFKKINNATNGYINNNEIWFVLQLHQINNDYNNYQHFFAIFDLDMNLIKYSELFKIDNSNIENCNGLIIENNNIVLSYVIKTNSYVSIYNPDNILWYKNEQEFSIII
jgi:mannosyltransferase OCH1-like enzyme